VAGRSPNPPDRPHGVVGIIAVRQRQGPQQLTHTVGPPAQYRIALGEQVADRLAAANEHARVSSTPLSAGVLGRGRRVAGSRGNQCHLDCSQGSRITACTVKPRPHAADQNNRPLKTRRRWRGSPRPAQPDRWRQESRRIGSTGAPARPKPRAILKGRNHSGLLPLQSFMAGRPGERQPSLQRGPAWPCWRCGLG